MSVSVIILIAVALVLFMALAWLIQRRTGNSGWIDTIWSGATGIVALVAIMLSDGDIGRKLAGGAMIALWSLRLASHIGWRSNGAQEDPRYAALIEEWGAKASLRLFLFLQVQAFAALVLVVSVLAAVSVDRPFGTGWDIAFLIVALAGLSGETLADRQLSHFKRQGKGKICEIGLWRYSRHPNYFFEWLFWCAWPFMALSGFADASLLFAIALLAPALMYVLLVHLSGIPPLEAHMLRSRGRAFEAYQQRVQAFFPGPRRSPSARQEPVT